MVVIVHQPDDELEYAGLVASKHQVVGLLHREEIVTKVLPLVTLQFTSQELQRSSKRERGIITTSPHVYEFTGIYLLCL